MMNLQSAAAPTLTERLAVTRPLAGSSSAALQEVREFLSVECRFCGHAELDCGRRVNQKFLNRACPKCGKPPRA
jgi:predicted nucleic-acid-binding Zn-ribbon protein